MRDERPDLAESFIAIVERAIDPDPFRRYASAGEMEAKLAGEPITKPAAVEVPKALRESPATTLTKRLAGIVAGTVVLTGVLGFVAARFFEVTLRIDRVFVLGVADMFAVGSTALVPVVAMWLVGAAVLSALAGISIVSGDLVARPARRMLTPINQCDPVRTAIAIVLTGTVWWLTVNLVLFGQFLGAVIELASNLETASNLNILGPGSRDIHRNHYFVSAYSSMLLGLAIWRWFPALERRSNAPSAVRVWKWGAVVVSVAFLLGPTLPRRLVWERFPVVSFDNRAALVIGSAGDDLLVFFPDEAGRPRRRLPMDAPGLRRTGESRFLFDFGQGQ